MNCSTSYCLGNTLMNPLYVWCMYYFTVSLLLPSYFLYSLGDKTSWHILVTVLFDRSVCCVKSWKTVLACLCYSFHCLVRSFCQWEKRTTLSTCSSRATHTYSCLFFRLSERLVYNIPCCCNMKHNFIPARLSCVQWAAWKNIDQIQRQQSR